MTVRSGLIVVVALLMIACDRAMRTTFSLTPARANIADTIEVRSRPLSAEAVAAVERVALQFGLTSVPGGIGPGCKRAWRLSDHLRTDKPRGGGADFVICALPLSDGRLEVQVSEIRGWSPRGEMLRKAMADTLARFGTIETRETP